MKKKLALGLALVLACGTLAGCGGSSEEGKDGAESGATTAKVIDIDLTDEEYAFGVDKDQPELLEQANAFIAKVLEDGTFDEICDKYFGDGEAQPVESASEMKTDGSQLIVATNAAFEPFEYMVGENYYGLDLENMALFAESIDKELYINNMEFDAVCLSVSAAGGSYEDENGNEVSVAGGVCDVAAAGLTVSDSRKEILDFSTSYYSASQMLIVAEDDTTFDACQTKEDVEAILRTLGADVVVGVQTSTTGQKYCEGDADWGFDGFGFTTRGYTNGAVAVQNILNKNIQYVVIDEGPAKSIVKRVNAAN